MKTLTTVKLFTHTDMDGYGCEYILKKFIQHTGLLTTNYNVSHCSVYNINTKVQEFLDNKDYLNYGKIYITDLSVSEDIAKQIESLDEEQRSKFCLLDHHETALYLNKYSFATVKVKQDDGKLTSGTMLLYNYLFSSIDCYSYFKIANTIRQYDIWEWKAIGDNRPKMLNQLFNILGPDGFFKLLDENYSEESIDSVVYSNTADLLLSIENRRMNQHCDEVCRFPITVETEIGTIYCVISQCREYIADIANRLFTTVEGCNIVAVVNPVSGTVALRSLGDINVAEYASKFGGGGHKNASGFKIKNYDRVGLITSIFE